MSARAQPHGEHDREQRHAHGILGGGEGSSNFHAGSSMLSGLILYGGIGWLLDLWWGTSFALPLGILVGAGLSFWSMWFRYGVDRSAGSTTTSPSSSASPSAVGRPPHDPDRLMEDDL